MTVRPPASSLVVPAAMGEEVGPSATVRWYRHTGRTVHCLLVWALAGIAVAILLPSPVTAESPGSPSSVDAADMSANAQDAARSEASSVMRYRMIYLPMEALDRFSEVFLPMARAEFDRRIGLMGSAQTAPAGDFTARIEQAVYSATLQGDSLLNGWAVLRVRCDSDKPAVLPLSPLGLAIGQAHWDAGVPAPGGAGDQPATTLAKIGVSDSGQAILMADRSGVLRFPWALQGRQGPTGALQFDIAVPECSVTSLQLDLPRELRPELDTGAVSLAADQPQNGASWRWSIDFAGSGPSTVLRIVARDRVAPEPMVLVRESTSHLLSPSGIDTRVELRLDALQRPLDELRVAIADDARLINASLDGAPLRWTTTELSSRPEILLELPTPIQGTGHVIRLELAAPSQEGCWRLSGVQVHNAQWQDGYITVEVPQPLVVYQVATRDCRQSRGSELPPPRRGEMLRFQCYKPGAEIEAVVRLRRAETQVRTGTTARLTSTAASAVVRADITARTRDVFQVEMMVDSDWVVDKVATEPPESLEDWKLANASRRGMSYQIRLREALSPGQTLRLAVYAHRRRWNQNSPRLTGHDLRVVQFKQLRSTEEIIAVGAESPWQVSLEDDANLERLPWDFLQEDESPLADLLPGGVLYRDNPGADRLIVTLSSDPPQIDGTIDIQASVDGDSLLQKFRFACRPESSSVRSLLIHFSVPLGGPATWSFNGEPSVTLVAEQLDEEERNNEGLLGGEAWRVTLPEPQGDCFQLEAQVKTPFGDAHAIPLASIIDATHQSGSVTVHSLDETHIDVQVEGAQAVPVEPPLADQAPTARATYRYIPSEEARVTVARADALRHTPQAYVWSCRLVSRFASDGMALHWASYRIENAGVAQLLINAPPDARLLEITVNGAAIPSVRDDLNAAVIVALPREKRFATVVVHYSTFGEPLGPFAKITAPWPRVDMPVLRRDWSVWLPPGFQRAPDRSTVVAWPTRLFGPLARSQPDWLLRHRDTGEPPDADWNTVASGLRDRALERLYQVASRLGESPNKPTWGQLIRDWDNAEKEADKVPLRVDSGALAANGITPGAEFMPQGAPLFQGQPERFADKMLADHALTLVTRGDGLLLTSIEATEAPAGVLTASDSKKSVASGEMGSLLTAQRWANEATNRSFWPAFPPEMSRSLIDAGWSFHSVPVATDGAGSPLVDNRTSLAIRQPGFVMGLCWALFLLAAGASGWVLRCRSRWAPGLLAGTAAAALLSPAATSSLLTAVFLGSVAAVLLRLVNRRLLPEPRMERPPVPDSSAGQLAPTVTASLILAALVAANLEGVRAQENGPVAAANDSEIYRVLSPMDSQQQPLGDYVYVAEPLFQALLRHGATGQHSLRNWMIRSADYRAAFFWNVSLDALDVTDIKATYEITVFRPSVKLHLPIQPGQAQLIPNTVRLDGRLLKVAPSPDNQGLEVLIDRPGAYNLELSFQPTVTSVGDSLGFNIAIPAVANSNFRLALPSGENGVHVAGAMGATIENVQTGERLYQLGPTSHLSVDWKRHGQSAEASTERDIEQLMLLDIHPGWARLVARFRCLSPAGRNESYRLYADPRLALLPTNDGQLTLDTIAEDGSQGFHYDFAQPGSGNTTWNAEFLLDLQGGEMDIATPLLRMEEANLQRNWLAIAVDEGMQCIAVPEDTSKRIDKQDFLAAWSGDVTSSPEQVIDLSDLSAPASLKIQRRELHVAIRQEQTVSFAESSAVFSYVADVQVTDGPTFQFSLDVPERLTVDEVTVTQNGTPQVVRWSFEDPGRLVVRLSRPIDGSCQVEVRAHQSVTAVGRAVVLPRISFREAEITGDVVRLCRQPAIRISLVDPGPYKELQDSATGQRYRDFGRLAIVLGSRGDASPGSVKLQLEVNRPKLRGRIVVVVQRGEQGWVATMFHRVRASDGDSLLDTLRYNISSNWGPELDGGATVKADVKVLPYSNWRRLGAAFVRTMRGEADLQITGPLTSAGGKGLQTPNIEPLGMDGVQRFYVLPTQENGREISWDTRGLNQIDDIPGFSLADYEDVQVYQVVQPDYRATLTPPQDDVGKAQIRLVEYQLDCRDNGDVVGTATFNVKPAGLGECKLVVPEGGRLIGVWSAGVPALMQQEDERTWNLQLGHQQLPLRIHAVFITKRKVSGRAMRHDFISAPYLSGLPVERTLWSLRCSTPLSIRPGQGTRVDLITRSLIRLEELVEELEELQAGVENVDQQDAVREYRNRRAYWQWERARLEAPENGLNLTAAQTDRLKPLDLRFAQIASDMGDEPSTTAAGDQPQYCVRPYDVWQDAESGTLKSQICLEAFEPSNTITLEAASPPQVKDLPNRLAVLVLLTALAVIVEPIRRRFPAVRRMATSPYLIFVAAGLIWWGWLAPAWIGPIILILGPLAVAASRARRWHFARWVGRSPRP